jgi:predicted ATP-dependent serine protease
VVYVSGEEGFSKTMKDKLVNNKINNPHLYFADISSYEEIKQEIEDNKFHFIFLDSLDTLGIDTARLRDLRAHYPQSTFVTISQSTKDGKMRGSQEIIHDTDIAVKVEDGIAVTTKNRYQARGAEFGVFPTPQKPVIKKIGEVRNVI